MCIRDRGEFDGLNKFREWILNYSIEIEGINEVLATEEELNTIDSEAKKFVKEGQKKAWENYQNSINEIKNSVLPLIENLKSQNVEIVSEIEKFNKIISVAKKDIFHLARKALILTRGTQSTERQNPVSYTHLDVYKRQTVTKLLRWRLEL